jgi:hypothetical protein
VKTFTIYGHFIARTGNRAGEETDTVLATISNSPRPYAWGPVMTNQEPLSPALNLAPVAQVATVAQLMLVVSSATNAFSTWSDWNRYWVAEDYVAGVPGVGVADLVGADNTSASSTWLTLLALLATAAVFLTWLWRARHNAELLSRAEHRLSRGWTIGGWFCPIVNLWFPRFVVDDIWRASRPGVPTDQYRVHGLEKSPLVRAWWYTLIVNWLVLLFLRFETRGPLSVDTLATVAVYSTVSLVLLVTAAALLARIIRQITAWQSVPRY